MAEFHLRPIEEILNPYPGQFLVPDAHALIEDKDRAAFATEEDEARLATAERLRAMLVPYEIGFPGFFRFAKDMESIHLFPPKKDHLAIVLRDPIPDYWTIVSFNGDNFNNGKSPQIEAVLMLRAPRTAVRALQETPQVTGRGTDQYSSRSLGNLPFHSNISILEFFDQKIIGVFGGGAELTYYRLSDQDFIVYHAGLYLYSAYYGNSGIIDPDRSRHNYFYNHEDQRFRRGAIGGNGKTIEQEIAEILQPIPLVDSNTGK